MYIWPKENPCKGRKIGVYGRSWVRKKSLLRISYNNYKKDVSGFFDVFILVTEYLGALRLNGPLFFAWSSSLKAWVQCFDKKWCAFYGKRARLQHIRDHSSSVLILFEFLLDACTLVPNALLCCSLHPYAYHHCTHPFCSPFASSVYYGSELLQIF